MFVCKFLHDVVTDILWGPAISSRMSGYGKIVLLYVDIGVFIRNERVVCISRVRRVVASLVRTTFTVQVAATP